MRNVSDKYCSGNQNTHFVINNFFFSKIVPFVRQCGKYCKAGRPQMTIWRMCIACCITKATHTRALARVHTHTHTHTHTLKICKTYCFSTAIIIARHHLNVTLYTHCLSCQIFLCYKCSGVYIP